MDCIQIELKNRKQIRDFLRLPARIYQNNPYWVPSIEGEERAKLDPKRHPFYKHSEAGFFIKYRNGVPVGRLSVLVNKLYNEHNHENTAFFTLFECEQDMASAQELFNSAFTWAKERRLNRIIGPRGFTALDGLGLLIMGFNLRPAMGLPYNLPYYPELIEAQGFEKEEDIVSGYLGPNNKFPERIHQLASLIEKRRGLHIAHFRSRRELRSLLRHLKTLYNEAMVGTSGGTPLTDEEITSMANQIIWFADPRLIKIVMKDDSPVGFLLAYPDISAALQKTKGRILPFGWITLLHESKNTDWININGAGMIEEYRGLGGTAILYSEMYKSVIENPRYLNAEIVQIGRENEKMQREMRNFGVDFYKTHRVYRKELS